MAKKKKSKKKKKGFTLIELLVVITIIGILAMLVIAAWGRARERSHVAKMKADVNSVNSMIQMYVDQNDGNAPATIPWGSTFTAGGVTYGALPASPSNHITYTYSNTAGDLSTYNIRATHTTLGVTDSFYCTSLRCAEGTFTNEE